MYNAIANCIYLPISALWFLLAAVKLQAWRRQRVPALLVMSLASAATAISFLCSAPVIADAVNDSSGVSFLGLLFVYVARLLFSAGAIILVLLWSPPSVERPGSRTWHRPYSAVRSEIHRKVTWVYIPVIAAMAVLFALFPAGLDSSEALDTTYAHRSPVLAFLVIYQAGFAWGLWQLSRICSNHAAALPALPALSLLRRSLRRMALGCALIGGYCLTKILAISAAAAGTHSTDWVGSIVSPALGTIGCLTLALGWAGAAAVAWLQRRADYRALRPLWTAAAQIDRRLVLDRPPRPWAEWLASRDLEWRITRRTREIRDGQLALRAWIPADVVETARRRADELDHLPSAEREAVIAAVAFAGGLRALRTGQRPARHCEDSPGIHVAPTDERRHLVLLARHLQGPLVARILADTA